MSPGFTIPPNVAQGTTQLRLGTLPNVGHSERIRKHMTRSQVPTIPEEHR